MSAKEANRLQTTNIALYNTARWALPLLQKPDVVKPSLLITSSLLWYSPIPQFFSLSMVKASQRNLVQSLQMTYPDVHIALLNVHGPVSEGDEWLNPGKIAERWWDVYSQEKEQWTGELQTLGAVQSEVNVEV